MATRDYVNRQPKPRKTQKNRQQQRKVSVIRIVVTFTVLFGFIAGLYWLSLQPFGQNTVTNTPNIPTRLPARRLLRRKIASTLSLLSTWALTNWSKENAPKSVLRSLQRAAYLTILLVAGHHLMDFLSVRQMLWELSFYSWCRIYLLFFNLIWRFDVEEGFFTCIISFRIPQSF